MKRPAVDDAVDAVKNVSDLGWKMLLAEWVRRSEVLGKGRLLEGILAFEFWAESVLLVKRHACFEAGHVKAIHKLFQTHHFTQIITRFTEGVAQAMRNGGVNILKSNDRYGVIIHQSQDS